MKVALEFLSIKDKEPVGKKFYLITNESTTEVHVAWFESEKRYWYDGQESWTVEKFPYYYSTEEATE